MDRREVYLRMTYSRMRAMRLPGTDQDFHFGCGLIIRKLSCTHRGMNVILYVTSKILSQETCTDVARDILPGSTHFEISPIQFTTTSHTYCMPWEIDIHSYDSARQLLEFQEQLRASLPA